MAYLLIVPAVLSLLVLGAHFFRAGNLLLVFVCIGAAVAVLIPRRWTVRCVQLILILGTLEWLRSMYYLVGERAADGQPWTRLTIILGLVAAFTAVSAVSLESRRVRARCLA